MAAILLGKKPVWVNKTSLNYIKLAGVDVKTKNIIVKAISDKFYWFSYLSNHNKSNKYKQSRIKDK